MAEELKTLINKRGQVKAKVSRFRSFIESAEKNKTISQLNNRLSRFKDCISEFDSIQSQIELLETDIDHNIERELFESSYFELLEKSDELLSLNNKPHLETSSNSSNTTNSESHHSTHIKLPTIQLPTFSGKYEDWLQFYELFQSVIESNGSLSRIQKFYYLKSSLQGPALNVLESLEVSSSNYETAWDLLKTRFDNKRVIVNNHVTSIFDIQKIERESGVELRVMLDTLNKHLRALKSLDQPIEHWDTLLVHIVSKKLDYNSIKLWEALQVTTQLPKFSDLTQFLESRCNVLEAVTFNKPSPSSKPNHFQHNNTKHQFKNSSTSSLVSSVQNPCPLCTDTHKIFQCPKFNSMPVTERHQNVKRLGLCINCLSKGHVIKDCSSGKCKVCGNKHNSLLHFESSSNQVGQTAHKPPSTTTLAVGTYNQVLLSTAIVNVHDKHGKSHQCRLLLDSGSQSNFISSNMVSKLKLKATPSNTPIVGIGQCHSNVTNSVECTIYSRLNSYKATLNCLVLPNITHDLPSLPVDIRDWNIPNHVHLADPQFFKPGTIDMLVGAEIFFNILSVGQFRPHKTGPILQKTSLGWIASGKVQTKQDAPRHSLLATDSLLHNQLKKFWELEECSSTARQTKTEDDLCEQYFAKTTTRDLQTGRYTVKLPLKQNINELGESYKMAEARFFQVERKLAHNPTLHQAYSDFMEEYEGLGHMEAVEHDEHTSQLAYYIPHLAVLREESSTTKVRVVFDASAKTSTGISLNDTMLVGPTIQDDVFSLISRFRFHRYVLTADVEKMYRQVNIDQQHLDLQRILWRRNQNEPVKIYRLKTVTYGTASAPFLAVRSLHQLAEDERDSYPLASKILTNDFYVDDLLTGTDSLDEAKTLAVQLTQLLKAGCFNLRKWSSNSSEVLQTIPPEVRTTSIDSLSNKQSTKILGMLWCAETDVFQYTIRDATLLTKISKRTILSEIASLFDPLGLLGPIILKAKIFMQTLWQLKLTWDESLPSESHSWWQTYRQQLASLTTLTIPRHVKAIGSNKLELHGFCDASEKAYGACVYVRSTRTNGEVTVNLLCSKSRVAPLTATTIPRLELCGALLLANLVDKVRSLNIAFDSYTLWSDSTIVLAWIKTKSATLKIFVGNRVNQIQHLTENKCVWKHVRTASNPADLISRGSNPMQLMDSSSLWWHGPIWLSGEPETWPSPDPAEVTDLPETRTQTTTMITLVKGPAIDVSRYSTLARAQRTTAWCLRFISNIKKKTRIQKQPHSTPLHPFELQEAITHLLKIDQQNHFSDDYLRLKVGKFLKQSSKLLALQPFMDDTGLMRVGGRLKNAQISTEQKHPILLSPKSHLTTLIIKQEHHRNLHAGTQLLLASLRQQYWPLRGRETVRRIVNSCIVCFKTNPKFNQPQMGDLPSNRLQQYRPFTNTGTDLCGPVYIKSSKRRNAPRTKGYVVVFICMSTKAIHLELVSVMTTEAFIAALKRFTARRGICANIYSDNGSNLVGANNELKELRSLFNSQEEQRKIINKTSAELMTWHFIPPQSPHMGGLWEAGVKAIKYHLRRVVGDASLTFEDLYTTLTAIEACVNSRPLTPLSSDPNDVCPLTPGNFLIGSPLTAIPEPSLDHLPVNRLSHWQRTQQISQHFWARWSKEYLSHLQERHKWCKDTPNIKIGQLVVVKEDNLPPLKWITARVIAVHPGADGRVRVATIKTSTGTYTRATNRLCVLPTEELPAS